MALEHFWNSWATNRRDIVLITCGSAASWMINKLINNRGGLHNRVTELMKIHPFNLRECELMLRSKNVTLDRYQILQLYMVTGGIPFYLDAVTTGKSAAQNIEELCFRKGGILRLEFNNLFSSLFKNPAYYERIVIALSKKVKGLTRKELSKATGIKTGGTLTQKLNDLEESGFISIHTSLGKKKQESVYRLSDFYSLFYLKFVKDNTDFHEGVWVNAVDNPTQRAWTGYAFEQVCLAHIQQIKKALGIGGVLTSAYAWRSTEHKKGIQIDLVIDRRDRIINLCEVKYSINSYSITKKYASDLRDKIGTFRQETGTKKAVMLTMITTYGLDENEHSLSLVQNDITMDALFE